MRFGFAVVVLATAAVMVDAQSQTAPAANPATTLGRGWSALGAQQPQRALQLARQLLQANPRDHDAISLAVAALTAVPEPVPALDEYEQWLSHSLEEDVFLLQPIAKSVLRNDARSQDPAVRFGALVALAGMNDADARRQLEDAARDQKIPVDVDAELAEAGDQSAVARLEAQVSRVSRADKSAAIDALGRANSKGSVQVLTAALKEFAPPSRMAAANALAELGAVEAIPALREALKDPDPAVRTMVGVALFRLGDPNAGTALTDLENSPIGEFRLLAASAAATKDPQGNWDQKVEPMLRDPDPMLRLQASVTLLKYGRLTEAARAVIESAIGGDSPPVRTAAVRALRSVSSQNLDTNLGLLRRLLRDRIPEVRIEAARTIGTGKIAH